MTGSGTNGWERQSLKGANKFCDTMAVGIQSPRNGEELFDGLSVTFVWKGESTNLSRNSAECD